MLVLCKDKDTLFSSSMLTLNILHFEQAGSNFRATYVVDWDKDNYFSILNVRRRKFEKERLEQQERMEAERAQKEEARQAELALAEEERQKVEQAAAALRLVLSSLSKMTMPGVIPCRCIEPGRYVCSAS